MGQTDDLDAKHLQAGEFTTYTFAEIGSVARLEHRGFARFLFRDCNLNIECFLTILASEFYFLPLPSDNSFYPCLIRARFNPSSHRDKEFALVLEDLGALRFEI